MVVPSIVYRIALLVLVARASSQGVEERRRCLPDNGRSAGPTPIEGFKLRLQWDTWPTSQITTKIAEIVLHEEMGFDVELKSALSAAEPTTRIYQKMAEGEIDAAFELWPYGKEVVLVDSFSLSPPLAFIVTYAARSAEVRGQQRRASDEEGADDLRVQRQSLGDVHLRDLLAQRVQPRRVALALPHSA